jgi:hypothetical protein
MRALDHLAPEDHADASSPVDSAADGSLEADAGSTTGRPGDGSPPIRTDGVVDGVDASFGAGAPDDATILERKAGGDPPIEPLSIAAEDDWEAPVALADDAVTEPAPDGSLVADVGTILPAEDHLAVGGIEDVGQPSSTDVDVD